MVMHLEGNNAPVGEERETAATRVVGSIPADLRGRYYRNGPNPRSGWSPHLFAGDGMVHSMALAGGSPGRYRNRYVRTPLYEHPGADRFALAVDPATGRVDHRVTTANTSIVEHGGRLLALEEGGLPYELTAGLDTVGPFTFDGRLGTAMTAHPKRCPSTGELLFFAYSLRPPFLTYYRASRTGELTLTESIDLPACSMMHDFAITATRAVFVDSCFVFDPRAASTTGSPWRWDNTHGARIGVMDRDGGEPRWYDIEPCHLSHTANAFDDGDSVVLTGTRLPPSAGGGGLPVMHEWRIDLVSHTVTEKALDDRSTEYPRVPDELVGARHRFVYTSGFFFEAEPDHGEIHKHDHSNRTTHRLPAGRTCGEPIFVARADANAEDDGYLLTFAHDRNAGTSYLLILDARDLALIAEVHLPVRVPAGFHGTWVPEP